LGKAYTYLSLGSSVDEHAVQKELFQTSQSGARMEGATICDGGTDAICRAPDS